MRKYIFIKILVIMILLLIAFLAAVFIFTPPETQQEFRGTFVMEFLDKDL